MISPTNAFAAYIDGGGLTLGIDGGVALIGTTPTVVGGQKVTLSARTTNYVLLNLTTGLVQVNTSGFTSGNYPIATVVTNSTGILTLTDSRPDVPAAGPGGGAVSSVFGRTGVVAAVATDYGTVGINSGTGLLTLASTTGGSAGLSYSDTAGDALFIGAGGGFSLSDFSGNSISSDSGGSVTGTVSLGNNGAGAVVATTGAGSIVQLSANGTNANLTAGGAFTTPIVNALSSYEANGTAGVSAGSFSSITAITSEFGLVTQLTGTSDARLKNTEPYKGGLAEILNILPVRYTWNAKGQEHTGFSGDKEYVGFTAQNVQQSIPEAITATEKSKDGSEEYLSFDDRPVVAALVNAVKELAARVEELERKI